MLFVGGPYDGSYMEVENPEEVFEVPMDLYFDGPASAAVATYKLMKIKVANPDAEFSLYVHEDMPMCDVILRLLMNYEPNNPNKFRLGQ